MVSDRISYFTYISLRGKALSLVQKSKLSVKGQGQLSRSLFSGKKMVVAGAFVFHKQLVYKCIQVPLQIKSHFVKQPVNNENDPLTSYSPILSGFVCESTMQLQSMCKQQRKLC